jgi:hypothetical protein
VGMSEIETEMGLDKICIICPFVISKRF